MGAEEAKDSGERRSQKGKGVKRARDDKGDEVATLFLHQIIDFAPVVRLIERTKKISGNFNLELLNHHNFTRNHAFSS